MILFLSQVFLLQKGILTLTREYSGGNGMDEDKNFAVELGDYIAASSIEYWIYGHSHRNMDKTIGNTECVSNQVGYVCSNERMSFNSEKYILIENREVL